MSKIIGIVQSIKKDNVKSGANVGKPYYKVMIDGKMLFAWAWPLIQDIKLGKPAEVVVEKSKKGDFLNIVSSRQVVSAEDEPIEEENFPEEDSDTSTDVVEEAEPAVANPRELQEESPKLETKEEYWARKDAGIGRMSALNTSVAYLAYCASIDKKGASPVTEEDVIEIAKRFERFAKTGK